MFKLWLCQKEISLAIMSSKGWSISIPSLPSLYGHFCASPVEILLDPEFTVVCFILTSTSFLEELSISGISCPELWEEFLSTGSQRCTEGSCTLDPIGLPVTNLNFLSECWEEEIAAAVANVTSLVLKFQSDHGLLSLCFSSLMEWETGDGGAERKNRSQMESCEIVCVWRYLVWFSSPVQLHHEFFLANLPSASHSLSQTGLSFTSRFVERIGHQTSQNNQNETKIHLHPVNVAEIHPT